MATPLRFKCAALTTDWRIYYVQRDSYRLYWAEQIEPPFRKTGMATSVEVAVSYAKAQLPERRDDEPPVEQLQMF